MSDLKGEVRGYCLDVIDKRGWRPFRDIKVDVVPKVNSGLGAYITLNDRTINVKVGEHLYGEVQNLMVDENLEGSRKLLKLGEAGALVQKRDEILRRLMGFVVPHEYGHHKICAVDVDGEQRVMDGCFEAIEGREYRTEVIQGLCCNVSNMFCDNVLNTVNANQEHGREFTDGMDLFYLLNLNENRRKTSQVKGFWNRLGGHKMDKAFTLFLNANHLLCRSPKEVQEKAKKYHPWPFFGFERKRGKLIDVFTGDKKLTSAIVSGKYDKSAMRDLILRLEDRSLWRKMAYDYTSIIYPLMRFKDDQYSWLRNPYDNEPSEGKEGKEQKQGSGGGSSGKEKQENNGKKGKGDGKDGQDKNDKKDKKDGEGSGEKEKDKGKDKKDGGGQDKKPEGKEGQDDQEEPSKGDGGRMRKYFDGKFKRPDKKDEDENPQQDPGNYRIPDSLYDQFLQFLDILKGQPRYAKQVPRLDALYRKRAGRMALFSQEKNGANQFEKSLGSEEMPLDEFSSRGVNWSDTKVITREDGTKDVKLSRANFPLVMPFEGGESAGGIPDLAWILDSSPSMGFEPFKGEGVGDYHLACLSYYSILGNLEDIGLAQLVNQNMIRFSDVTEASGWRNYYEMGKVKQVLFNYGGSSTFLDPQAIRDLRTTRRDNFICFMLSDTQFNFDRNEKEVLDEVQAMISTGGVGFFLFNTGSPTTFSHAVEDMGMPVRNNVSAKDFMNSSISFTKDLYGRFAEK